MARVLTYALEFRGEAAGDGDVLVVRASATPCSHVTQLGDSGVESGFVYEDGAEEAFLQSLLSLDGNGSFAETGTVDFGHGHELHLRTTELGRLAPSAAEELRHGTAVLEVVGGTRPVRGRLRTDQLQLRRQRHRRPDRQPARRDLPRYGWSSLCRTQSVTSRATSVTRKICPHSASSTVSACGSPTDGERSPNPSVVSATKLK